MTEPKIFSIAVVRGASRGRILRSDKKRIAVGSSKENDLVLEDADVLPRHFVVLVDQGRWRVHALTADKSVSIGNEWIHPTNGQRGAFISTGTAEVLLCPGHLGGDLVEEELARRGKALGERAAIKEAGAREGGLPRTPRRLVPAADTTVNPSEDLIESSQLPTVSAEKLPEQIRQAARARLQEARGFEAPSVARERAVRTPDANTILEPVIRSGEQDGATTVDPLPAGALHGIVSASTIPSPLPSSHPSGLPRRPISSGGFAGRVEETRPRGDTKLPEVVPEPEGPRLRIAQRPNSEVITAPEVGAPFLRHDRQLAGPIAPSPHGNGAARNAWGDKVDRFGGRGAALTPLPAVKNAWGGEPSRRPKIDHGPAIGSGRVLDEASRGGMASAPTFDRGPPLGLPIALESLSGRDEPGLAILREPDGEYATAIRLLGTRLEEFMRTLGYRAYMITSPEPLTGKSTVAANLALALAEDTHRRVALIEANFRHPRLAQIFGAPEGRGLIALLDGRAQIGEAAVKVTDRNLVIIPSGGRHPSPAEMLAAPRFKALVAELANTVDIAIIDAPSVMPFADANILLPLVDAALLVVTEGRTEASWMAKARAQIGDARILGAVYNKIPKSKRRVLRRELKQRLKA